MDHRLRIRPLVLLFVFSLIPSLVRPQSVELRWTKDFPKPVSWYLPTSAGVLLVESGKTLTAVNAEDGRQLWQLPDFDPLLPAWNLFEIPGMGVVIINDAKIPGAPKRRLIALNLLTGARLWDRPQIKAPLLVVPLPDAREVLLASLRLQRKVLASEAGIRAYPFRFEFERINLLTGNVEWNAQYPHVFALGSVSLTAAADHLFIYYGNCVMACMDLSNGKPLWESGSKFLGSDRVPLPLAVADGQLIYALKTVQAVDPATNQPRWKIEGLGKISWLYVYEDLLVAIGDDNVAAADVKTGTERWRVKTHGHTSNLVWDKTSDAILYTDGTGLHSLNRSTGKSLLDAPLQDSTHPRQILLASPDAVVLAAADPAAVYNFKTGKKLFAAGKLNGFFRPFTFQDRLPTPMATPMDVAVWLPYMEVISDSSSQDSVLKYTLLPDTIVSRLKSYSNLPLSQLEAFESELPSGAVITWWLDPNTDRQIQFQISDGFHYVNRPLGLVLAVDAKKLWAADLHAK
ncbi:MAG: PQQ-binding-like beta-propeller repeat protein [Candidatus Acidiferrum sp.]